MNYNNAKQQFEKYLDGYDSNNDKVRLKIIHTYGVVHAMEEICHRMQLSEEDTELAQAGFKKMTEDGIYPEKLWK